MRIEYLTAGKWKPIYGCGDDLIDKVIAEIYYGERPFRFTQLGSTSETDWLFDSLLDYNMPIGAIPKVFEVNEVYVFRGSNIYTLEKAIKSLEGELALLKLYQADIITLGS